MRAPAKRVAMLGMAALAILAAVLILVLSSGGDQGRHPHARIGPAGQSDIQVAAGYLGISTADLRQRLRSGLTLAQVADAGRGTSGAGLLSVLQQARAATLSRRGLSSDKERERLATITRGLERELGRARRGHSRELTLASGYLGIGAKTLLSRLASGESLAEIAEATAGKSRSGLIEALTGPRERRLRAASTSHQITAATAKMAIDAFRARTASDVDRKGPTGSG
jgi:hypothetical protein